MPPSMLESSPTNDGVSGGRTLPQAVVESVAAGTDLVLFRSTLIAADTPQLGASGVLRTYSSIVDALTTAVADGRLPISLLQAAAVDVADAAHDELCA